MGFEPTLGFPKHAFQACAFSRSATSPLHLILIGLPFKQLLSYVAERGGFEPPVELPPQQFSRLPPSAARPPLLVAPFIAFLEFWSVPSLSTLHPVTPLTASLPDVCFLPFQKISGEHLDNLPLEFPALSEKYDSIFRLGPHRRPTQARQL